MTIKLKKKKKTVSRLKSAIHSDNNNIRKLNLQVLLNIPIKKYRINST